MFSADEVERKSLARSLASIALKYRGRVHFAAVDARKHAFSLEYFGLQAEQLPAFVVQTGDEVFSLEHSLKVTADTVDEFIVRTIGDAMA